MRILSSSCLVCWLALPACASDPSGVVPGSAGSSGGAALAGAPATAGSAGALASGGAASAGAGAASAAGYPSTPQGGAGGGDDGDLFEPGSYVPYVPGGGAPGKIPGDGAVATANLDGGGVKGTAVFTQTGTDVTVVVKLTSCPNGAHSITLQDGLSCDNETTIKGVWSRGQLSDSGNSTISCSSNGGNLSYTRKGTSDKAWAITGKPDVDPSAHVMAIRSSADQSSNRLVCGNFF